MAYLITGACTKDEHCIDTCQVNGIHPTKDEQDFATAAQLYVNPTECIDSVPVCPTTAIFTMEELSTELREFIG
jgi:ferredoxin